MFISSCFALSINDITHQGYTDMAISHLPSSHSSCLLFTVSCLLRGTVYVTWVGRNDTNIDILDTSPGSEVLIQMGKVAILFSTLENYIKGDFDVTDAYRNYNY